MRVRDRRPRGLGWWSRAWLSATLAWAVLALFAVLPVGAGTVAQAHADSGTTTVAGPPVWQPAKGTSGPNGSITVSPTTNLADQVVHVSWKGFTPSVTATGAPATSATVKGNSTFYAVRVYECRGTKPQVTDCYGSTLYNQDPAKGFQQRTPAPGLTTPDLPSDMQLAVTGQDGTGSADIEVWPADQSQSLGCDATHPCSIVVEPNYGGDSEGATASLNHDKTGAPHCEVHSYDLPAGYLSTAADSVMGSSNLVNRNATGEACAWNNARAIPLTFAPTAASCKSATADLTTTGSPGAERALQQWRAGACLANSPLYVSYTAQGEPATRSDFLKGGGADLALTSLPDASPAPRPYVYVPLNDSSISVVYIVDDPKTGQQIRQMTLDARLLAKELTQSYAQSAPGFQPPSVAGNPRCIFEDQEFLALNPPASIAPAVWPSCDTSNPQSLPIVMGNETDLVTELTSWIVSDPQAAAFLQGAPDNYSGMHVDPSYERPGYSGYPVDILRPQDATGFTQSSGANQHQKAYEWSPVLSGLGDTVRHLLSDTPTCEVVDGTGLYPRCPAEAPGRRQLIGIVDSADAESYSMPEAKLVNAQGTAVAPSFASVQAAVNDMPVDPRTNTQQLPYGTPGTAYASDPNAYPLTAVDYAMAPTSGLGDAKAAAASAFLAQVTDPGSGQLYGRDPGRLGLGYLDLTQVQLGIAQAAVAHVANQDSALPGNQTPPAGTPGGTPTPTPTPTGAAGQPGAGSVTVTGTTVIPNGGTLSGTGSLGSAGTTGGGTITGNSLAGGTGGGDLPPGSTPVSGKGGSATPSAAAGSPSPSGGPQFADAAAGTPAPDRAGLARVLLPVVLIVGAVLLLGGPAALVLSGTAAGGRALARLRGAVNRGGKRS
ncbi:hypothetical protein [Kitasatospora sp. LaBMicrA B282]|uniref:hypothetical protein n=1 Tax=Kitasatospora sp. LaBMicrA B282 TaxID=3420949 RepID=UPI003D13D352